MTASVQAWGLLLPESVMSSPFVAVLATFVAINTVMYLSLAVAKLLPKVYVSDYLHGADRRAHNRSIHPDEPARLSASAGHDRP